MNIPANNQSKIGFQPEDDFTMIVIEMMTAVGIRAINNDGGK
jgi:hypothetical protein